MRKYVHGPVIKRIKIPYHDRIRGLELKLDGRVSGQIIHSTTNPESIGHVYSNGCIGMYEDDMLELFSMVGRGTPVVVCYKLVEFDGKKIYFHRNIYDLPYDMKGELHKLIVENNIPMTKTMENMLLIRGLSRGVVDLDKFMEEFQKN